MSVCSGFSATCFRALQQEWQHSWHTNSINRGIGRGACQIHQQDIQSTKSVLEPGKRGLKVVLDNRCCTSPVPSLAACIARPNLQHAMLLMKGLGWVGLFKIVQAREVHSSLVHSTRWLGARLAHVFMSQIRSLPCPVTPGGRKE